MNELYRQPIAWAGLAFVVSVLAERLHTKRIKRVIWLAFGPEERPRGWVMLVPVIKPLATAALVWGLMYLLMTPPTVHGNVALEDIEKDSKAYKRVLFILDLSPSMKIEDAGPKGDMPRADWGREIARTIINRFGTRKVLYSIEAFYTKALFVVKNARDLNVVYNVFDDLPLEFAFEAGKTDLGEAIKVACDELENWPKKSTTVVLITDGDTVDFESLPRTPKSVDKFMVIGLGDTARGTTIDDHLSKQGVQSLRHLAQEMNGHYYDVNKRYVSTAAMRAMAPAEKRISSLSDNLREFAIAAVVIGSAILTFLPLLLQAAGSNWKVQSFKTIKSNASARR